MKMGWGDGNIPEVARTYVIYLEVKGYKRITQRRYDDNATLLKFWSYSRTIDGIIEKFNNFLNTNLIPYIESNNIIFDEYIKFAE